jgi:uncharacterized protein YodC (DUF2158 family)
MSQQTFKPGDIVRLKSGGPKMTVVRYAMFAYDDVEKVECRWFDAKGAMTISTFIDHELEGAAADTIGSVRLQRS